MMPQNDTIGSMSLRWLKSVFVAAALVSCDCNSGTKTHSSMSNSSASIMSPIDDLDLQKWGFVQDKRDFTLWVNEDLSLKDLCALLNVETHLFAVAPSSPRRQMTRVATIRGWVFVVKSFYDEYPCDNDEKRATITTSKLPQGMNRVGTGAGLQK